MQDLDRAALAALPAILSYVLDARQPPIDDQKDPRWLEAFLEARDLAFEVGNHWAFRE